MYEMTQDHSVPLFCFSSALQALKVDCGYSDLHALKPFKSDLQREDKQRETNKIIKMSGLLQEMGY